MSTKKSKQTAATGTSLLSSNVYAAKEIIEEYLQEKKLAKPLPSVPEIANRVGMSQSTLKRYFKEYFKTSIYDYYLKRKMEIAKKLLAGEHENVDSVARKMGYVKTNNFIDMFKKFYSVTPGEMKMKKRRAKAADFVE